jgi:hypothetical protein
MRNMEFVAPYTPQHNGVVERRFATDGSRALAMILDAQWDSEHQGRLWAEATNTVSKLANLMANKDGVTPNFLYDGKEELQSKYLKEYGRVGYVTRHLKFKGKFKDKSVPMTFIGYAADHLKDVYQMYNPDTKCVIETRDVHAWANFEIADVREPMRMFDTLVIPEGNLNTDEEVENNELHPPQLEYREPDSDDDDDDDDGDGGGNPQDGNLDDDPNDNSDEIHHEKTDPLNTRPDLAAGRNEDDDESGSKPLMRRRLQQRKRKFQDHQVLPEKVLMTESNENSEGWISILQR